MRTVIVALSLLFAIPAQATTQAVKRSRLNYILQKSGFAPAPAKHLLEGVHNVYYYDTYAELAAATPSEGVFGWAIDTNAMYYYTGAVWTAVLSASSSGLLGTNSGTIGNEVNNVWNIAENNEDLTLTFSADLVTFASGTSALLAFTPASSFAGDVSFGGGAGAIDVSSSGDSSLVAKDADSTAFCMGAAGALDIACIDSTDASPALDVKGIAGQVALHVDVGLSQFDEDVTIGAGVAATDYVLNFNGETNDGSLTWMEDEARLDIASHLLFGAGGAGVDYALSVNGEDNDGSITYMEDEDRFDFDNDIAVTGDANLNGGAGAITVSGSGDASLVAADQDSTAFCMGAAGALDIACIDSTDASPALDVKGVTAQIALHVDVGLSQFDEDVTIGAGAASVDYVLNFNGETDDGSLVWMEDESRLDVESHLEVGAGAAGVDYVLSFNGEDNDGSITYMEDEDRLDFDNDIAVTGDAVLNGGAGAITVSGSGDASLVAADADPTAFCMGAAGALDIACIDSTDASPAFDVKGVAGQVGLHVDVGLSQFDEDVTVGAGAAGVDYVLNFNGEDNDGSITYMEDEDRIDFDNDVAVANSLAVAASITVVNHTIGIPFDDMRVFDDPNALLPNAGATDDLGHVIGTPGTNADSLQTEDLKAEGGNPTLNKAMFSFVMPSDYLAGSTVALVASAGMITTISDDTATLDFSCWVPDYANADGSVSTDLIGTAAQDINSLTFADKSFSVEDDQAGHNLAAGDVVQCIATTSVSDGATATAVIAAIRNLQVQISN